MGATETIARISCGGCGTVSSGSTASTLFRRLTGSRSVLRPTSPAITFLDNHKDVRSFIEVFGEAQDNGGCCE